jgi:hypothetical protein
LTRSLRSHLTTSSRKKAETFVSRLSRKLVMNKRLLTMNNFKRKVWKWKKLWKKWKFYDFIYKFTCLRKAQLFNKWLNIAFDEQ